MRAVLPERFVPRDTGWMGIDQVKNPTVFDGALAQDKDLWNAIIERGLDTLCCPQGRAPYTERPWIFMPDSGRRFREIGSELVASITQDGTNQAILQFPVPVGYDGVIDTVVCGVTANGATGFIEGSGDVTWRLAADSISQPRYLRDMGNILYSLGSLTVPIPTPNSNLRVYSGNLVTFYAAIPAVNPLTPTANIVCSCSGWFYSR